MTITYTIILGIFGTVFGSFFNVIGLRIPKKESIISPGSHCTNCQRQLTIFDLIPVISYALLRGKCRGCGVRFSPIYMITELLTGGLFAFAFWKIGWQPELVVALLFISLLMIINVSDIAYMIIPDKVLLFFLPLFILTRAFVPLEPWWDSVLGAIIGFGILLFIAVVSKGGMGGGDIKLFFVIGFVFGTVQTLLTLFLAAIIGMVVGIVILKIKNKGRKTPVPFGPSISLAAIIVYFYGELILQWYGSFFNF